MKQSQESGQLCLSPTFSYLQNSNCCGSAPLRLALNPRYPCNPRSNEFTAEAWKTLRETYLRELYRFQNFASPAAIRNRLLTRGSANCRTSSNSIRSKDESSRYRGHYRRGRRGKRGGSFRTGTGGRDQAELQRGRSCSRCIASASIRRQMLSRGSTRRANSAFAPSRKERLINCCRH